MCTKVIRIKNGSINCRGMNSRKRFGLVAIILEITNGEMEDILRLAKPLEDSGLLMKVVTQKSKNDFKE